VNEGERIWRVVRGDEVLADLVVTDGDFPWLTGEVRPGAGFAEVRQIFDDESRWADVMDQEPEQWEAAYHRVRAAVSLVAPDGCPVPEFLLHIEGARAWWRWSDEPFPDEEEEPG
jgi:hypothetical protein